MKNFIELTFMDQEDEEIKARFQRAKNMTYFLVSLATSLMFCFASLEY